jgi:hypothetical protein
MVTGNRLSRALTTDTGRYFVVVCKHRFANNLTIFSYAAVWASLHLSVLCHYLTTSRVHSLSKIYRPD